MERFIFEFRGMYLALLVFENQEYCTLIDTFLSLVLTLKRPIIIHPTLSRFFISEIAYFWYKENRNQRERGNTDQYREHTLDGKYITQFTDYR
jgi:hypothetical protein